MIAAYDFAVVCFVAGLALSVLAVLMDLEKRICKERQKRRDIARDYIFHLSSRGKDNEP